MTDPEPTTSLAQIAAGTTAIVSGIETDEIDAARIKRMGLCEGRRIHLVKTGDPMILRVVGTRVGISARLASGISVCLCRPRPANGACED